MKGSSALGELLRFLRGPYSQVELARLLNVDRTTISKAESGAFTPSEEIVNKWIEIGYENFKRMQIYAAAMMAAEQQLQKGA